MGLGVVSAVLAGVLFSVQAEAGRRSGMDRGQPEPGYTTSQNIPDCRDDGSRNLSVDNTPVLKWKANSPNQFKARAHVRGEVVRIFDERTSHNHFEIKIGPNAKDVLEVIYNRAFGELRDVREGMTVQACGDYITATAPSGPYPASPSGAIIHWVHFNPREGGHPHGFLILDGELFGDDVELASRRNRGRGRHSFDVNVSNWQWTDLAQGILPSPSH